MQVSVADLFVILSSSSEDLVTPAGSLSNKRDFFNSFITIPGSRELMAESSSHPREALLL